jgi:hypothetical protein
MEKYVHQEVYKHIEDHKLLSELQAAYKQKSSTTTQLLQMYDHILKAMDHGKKVIFSFCDVSKAFDRVWHQGILYKIQKMGIKGRLLNWSGNYLAERKPRVLVNGNMSQKTSITAGVPQGSIVGPLPFIIYTNDLIEMIDTEIRLYADDDTLYVAYTEGEHAKERVEENLTRIQEWATRWFVKFNPEKTIRMKSTRKRNPENFDIIMAGEIIEQMDKHKHLGIIFQKN